nr:hypothetical protein GCM10025730_07310 [Promicromonospora thailandica]
MGTCCGGTGLENHVRYQDAVYFRSAPGTPRVVWVNQYVASTLRWPDAGVRLTQDTRYPLEGGSRIRVDVTGDLELRLRVPGWVTSGAVVRVDGEAQTAGPDDGTDGAYLVLRRDWRPGTVVEIDLPLTLREVATPDDPSVVSLELGPTVLLARSAATTWLPVATAAWRRLDGTLDAPLVPGDGGTWHLGDLVLEPAWSGSDERYHLYLRRSDATIAFAGADPAADSGVPDVARPDGRTFLDTVWSDGGFADRPAFLEAVLRVTHEFAGLGLLGGDEARRVLVAAARCDVGRAGGPAAPGAPAGEEAALLARAPEAAHTGSAPRVAIVPAEAPAVSGWHLRPVALTVSARADAGQTAVEVRVGEAPWTPAGAGPLVLADGVHTVTARAVDSSGRERRVVREVSVDTRPPVTTATVRRLGARGVEISLSAADDVSGVDSIRWKGPDTFWATFAEPFTRALSDEPQVIEYTSTDRAGNQEPVRTLVLPGWGEPAAAVSVTPPTVVP